MENDNKASNFHVWATRNRAQVAQLSDLHERRWIHGYDILVPVEYFANAAVRNLETSTDLTRTNTLQSHLKDFYSQIVRQWSTISEHATVLIHRFTTWINIVYNVTISLRSLIGIFKEEKNSLGGGLT